MDPASTRASLGLGALTAGMAPPNRSERTAAPAVPPAQPFGRHGSERLAFSTALRQRADAFEIRSRLARIGEDALDLFVQFVAVGDDHHASRTREAVLDPVSGPVVDEQAVP